MKTRAEISIEIAEFVAKDHSELFRKLSDPDYKFLPRGNGQGDSARNENRKILQKLIVELKEIIKRQP